jgi:hypothetical protein
MLQNDKKLKNKITAIDVQRSNFVILNMVKKKVLEVIRLKVFRKRKKYNHQCKESSPEPDAMVTQGVTYPFCVVKINSKKKLLK